MMAAQQAIDEYGENKPLLIAVTVLTSMEEADLKTIGIEKTIIEQVTDLASLARDAGLAGVVCSPHEVKWIKAACGSQFITITPGIRLSTDAKDDQSRIMTPQQALAAGCDYMVIGRPITKAKEPAMVIAELLKLVK